MLSSDLFKRIHNDLNALQNMLWKMQLENSALLSQKGPPAWKPSSSNVVSPPSELA